MIGAFMHLGDGTLSFFDIDGTRRDLPIRNALLRRFGDGHDYWWNLLHREPPLGDPHAIEIQDAQEAGTDHGADITIE